MFRPRQRHGGANLGLFLLAYEIMNVGLEHVPPITLATIGAQVAVYLGLLDIYWPSSGAVCISTATVWYHNDWKRLILGALYHADDWHLYFNMVSFMWKGRTLERRLGSGYFAYLLTVFTVLTSVTLVGLNMLGEHALGDPSYIGQCAVGFSGVIFALKVVTTYMLPPGVNYVMNIIPVPSRIACWVELALIQILIPNASFTGHLAGILVGLAYVKGPLKNLMQPLASMFNFGPRPTQLNYGAGTSGYRRDRARYHHQPGYAQNPGPEAAYQQQPGFNPPPHNNNGYAGGAAYDTPPEDEDEQLQEAIRQSMRENYRRPEPSAPQDTNTGQPHPSPSNPTPGNLYPDLTRSSPPPQEPSYEAQNDINEMRRRRIERLQNR